MKLTHYLRKALSYPAHVTVKKGFQKAAGFLKDTYLRSTDKKESTYFKKNINGNLCSFFPAASGDHLLPQTELIADVTKHYIEHRFDLLGSGWVEVKHGVQCRGLEGYRYDMGNPIEVDAEGKWLKGRINESNLFRSQQIWQLINDIKFKTPHRIDRWIARGRQNSNFKIDYLPIDWHLDFKSGYRWSESTWYKDTRYGHKLGVDVKVPWELGRMQHLPQLAFAYALAAQSSKPKAQSKRHGQETVFEIQKSIKTQLEPPERYLQEFRNQVLDFIAANPSRFGVNWACTSDVAIRVANWLAAYDLFCAYGAEFDREFLEVFKRIVYEHGRHIINNLEWNEEHRTNHYLSDIAGLLFVAAYLPCSPEIDGWLAFAVQELINELENQFYRDGGNFEASTSYHRFAAEIVIYVTALVLGLPEEKYSALKNYDHKQIKGKPVLKPSPLSFYRLPVKGGFEDSPIFESPFPGWYFERLEKMAEFTMHLTKPNNHIPQIGDNDSGRFFKFQPTYKKITVAQAKKRYLNLEGYEILPDNALYWDEDFLDHRHLVTAINGLFDRDDFTVFAGNGCLETNLVRDIGRGIRLSSYKADNKPTAAEKVRIGSDKRWSELCGKLGTMPENKKQTLEIPLPDGTFDGLKLFAYPDFGLYIYRSKGFYLSIRCGPVGQNGFGGHAHNDQLSIELQIDLIDITVDPGTYLYTPLPDIRNQYRSVTAHFGLQLTDGREPGRLGLHLFQLPEQANAECLYFQKFGFAGLHHGYGDPVFRLISFKDRAITIVDFTTGHLSLKPIKLFNRSIIPESPKVPISPGYGLQYH